MFKGIESIKQILLVFDRRNINTVGQITLCKNEGFCPTLIPHSAFCIPN